MLQIRKFSTKAKNLTQTLIIHNQNIYIKYRKMEIVANNSIFWSKKKKRPRSKNEKENRKVPQNVNSQESSRVKASMVDNLSLTHPHSLWHPVQEGKVSREIEVDKFGDKVPRAPWASSVSTDVPLGKVDPVIEGLDSEESKGQQEGKSTEYVD